MNTKLLKQKILDLAIRGKLVPQDPNDEPASVLLGRIKAEKERLIAEGKIKRSKKSAQTSDKPHYENVPFDIPDSWEWIRLSDIASFGGGKTPSMNVKSYWDNGRNLWVTSKDMKRYRINDSIMKISDEALSIMNQYEPGTILIVTRSGILRHSLPVAILDKKATVNQDLKTISLFLKELNPYIFLTIKANESFILKEYHKDGTTVDSINFEKFSNILLPLPPVREQLHICSVVEGLFRLIDDLEASKQNLQDVIKQTKSKVLDLAIHGKLVPQDPTDEPASELLKRINPDAKPCDTSHYENLPKSWGVATIDQVCSVIGGLWTGKKPPFIKVGVIRNTNFSKDFKLDLSNVAYLEVEVRQFEKRRLQYGDLILEKSGGSDKQPVGRVVLYDKNDGEFSYSNFTSVLRINMQSVISPQYLYLALLNAYLMGSTRTMQKQTTGIHNLMMEKYLTLDIAIPPRKEQNRIVESVNILFKMLDDIAAEL